MLLHKKVLLIIVAILSFVGLCAFTMVYTGWQDAHSYRSSFSIHEGIIANHAKTIKFEGEGHIKAKVLLEEPVVVSQSNIPLEWGYYQFPSIFRLYDGNLLVTWQMKEDAIAAYAKADIGKNKMLSTDNGKTWIDYDNRYSQEQYLYSVKRSNGECLRIISYIKKANSQNEGFPKPVFQYDDNGEQVAFYRETELPSNLQGLNLHKWQYSSAAPTDIKWMHFPYNDKYLYKCISDDHIFLWVGHMLELSNKEVIAYSSTSYHTDNDSTILPSGISFYKMNERNNTFDFLGEIPYEPDLKANSRMFLSKSIGFSEPALVEMSNGNLLCVARSTMVDDLTPMYKSISKDGGITWSKPEAFTPNGVYPNLIRLGNGTLVLSSGRPGVQLRFCFDGNDKKWTEPIEMMPFPMVNGVIDTFGGSCGYTYLLPIDDNSFFIAYSYFDKRISRGKYMKSIICRKITVEIE